MDVYKIGIALSMTSNHAGVLATMTNALTHAHVKAGQLQGSLNRVQAAAFGAVQAIAGFAMLKGLDRLIERGNELTRVMRNMEQAGASAVQVKHADDEARRLTSIYRNMSRVDVMHAINDARGIFGSQDTAIHEVPGIIRAGSFLRAYQGEEKGKGSHSALMAEMSAALKSGEIAGKITPAEMFKHIDGLVAMKVAFGEQLKIGQYLTAQRHAGAAARNWSDDFRYGIFGALVQENGPNAGTMLATLGNKVVGGSGWTTAAAKNAMNLGLLDPDKVEYDKNGRVKRIKPGGVKGWETFADNPQLWVDKFLKPLVERSSKDPARQQQLIASIFPNQNASKAVTEMIQQGTKFHKDAALANDAYRKLQNGGAEKYTAGSWDYQKQAFATQLDNVIVAVGSALVPKATENLAALNEQLIKMSTWAANPEHAGTIEAIGKGIAVIGTALIAGGGVAILAALGPAGWLAAGITAFGAALIAFKGSEMHKSLNDWVQNVETELGKVITAIANEIKSWPARLGEAIAQIGTDILNALKGALGGLAETLKKYAPPMAVPGGISYDGGTGVGGMIHKASLGSAANSNLPGVSSSGLAIKPGAASGSFHPALLDAARAAGGGRVTALNDSYHRGTGSMHARGLAVDLTGNPASVMANARAAMAAAGLVEGKDYKLLNEYAHPSRRSTGGHVHLQFNNKGAADAFSRSRQVTPPTAGPPPKQHDQMVFNIPVHIGGERVAHVVSRQIAQAGRYPSRIGGSDGYGSWRPPGVTVPDAA